MSTLSIWIGVPPNLAASCMPVRSAERAATRAMDPPDLARSAAAGERADRSAPERRARDQR
jgi:hypothetical protein